MIPQMIRSSELLQFGWLFSSLLRLSARQANTDLGMLYPKLHTGGNKGEHRGVLHNAGLS